MAQPYTYRPLSTSSTIRLIRILPDRVDGSIVCMLYTFEHEQAPPYTALSYLWGDPTPTREIRLGEDGDNSGVHRLHENLWHFLDYAWTQSMGERLFWIDSLSLDQENVAEKSQQVPRMTDIYAKADEVLIWLGHDAEVAKIMPIVYQYNYTDDGKLRSRSYYDSDMKEEEIEAIEFLNKLEYWYRVWIVQDFALAKRGVVACNDTSIDLDTFTSIMHRSPQKPFGYLFFNLCYLRKNGGNLPLAGLLQNFSISSCSQPIDGVYGFLGLTAKHLNGVQILDLIDVDYNKSPHEVYWDVIFKFQSIRVELLKYGPEYNTLFSFMENALDLDKEDWTPYRSWENYARMYSIKEKALHRHGDFALAALRANDAINELPSEVVAHLCASLPWDLLPDSSIQLSELQHAAVVGLHMVTHQDTRLEWTHDWSHFQNTEKESVATIQLHEDGCCILNPELTMLEMRAARFLASSKAWTMFTGPPLDGCKRIRLQCDAAQRDLPLCFDMPDIPLRIVITKTDAGSDAFMYLDLRNHSGQIE